MKKTRKRTPRRRKAGMLITVAESIGSTLGTIAARTGSAKQSLRIRKAGRKRRVKKA